MSETVKRILGPLVGLILFGAALYVLQHELRDYQYRNIVHDLRSIEGRRLIIAGLLAAFSYVVLTFYDVIAIRYTDSNLPYSKVAFASFIAYTLSHNLGFSVLTGGAARFRLFSVWGLSPLKISMAIGFSGMVFWLGFFLLAGFALLFDPAPLPTAISGLPLSLRAVGLFMLIPPAFAFYFWAVKKRPIHLHEWEFPAPPRQLLFASLTVATVDWMLAAAVAFILLPDSRLSFLQFVGVFQLSQIIGLLSHVPGGLGIFESLMLVFYGTSEPKSAVLSALIAYRAVYYFIPLLCALCLFAAYELRLHRVPFSSVGQKFQSQAATFVAPAFTFLVFLSGAVLLASGATPAVGHRMEHLSAILPLPVIEFSHFLASLAGVTLIIIARGLNRRLDAAYLLSMAVLCIGIFLSLFKGFDYEEALLLALVLILLIPCRPYFYRKASLLTEPLSATWLLSVGIVFAAITWLLFFCYKHVEYSNDLWWKVSFLSDAPRSLRASVGAFSLALAYGALRLLSPVKVRPELATAEELQTAATIVSRSKNTTASLVLLGDKSILFDERREAFVMYRVVGPTWIALGDPVGNEASYPELIWNYCETSDRYGGKSVFYQVGAENLHYYVETGLEFIKLGEEAIIDLPKFSLEGKSKSSLRHSCNKLRRDNWSVRIIEKPEVTQYFGDFRRMSDDWLKAKNTREKSFSLGYFDEDYLQNFPAVVVERDKSMVAFANIWPGDGRSEISVDLMRHSSDAPNGVMDFMLVELMMWAQAKGYQRFNLGMAPFSGFEDHKLAPLWTKLGRALYQRGERYYNFQGIRHYKEKFGPMWEPRFLAAPGGLDLPRVLTNVATLISGGLRGIISK